jgi:hypothetical protein
MKRRYILGVILFFLLTTFALLIPQRASWIALFKESNKKQEQKKRVSQIPPEIFGRWKIIKMFDGSWVFREDSLQPEIFIGKTITINRAYYEFPAVDEERLLRLDNPLYKFEKISLEEFHRDTPKLSDPDFLDDGASIIRISVIDSKTGDDWDYIGWIFWVINGRRIIFPGGSPYYEAVKL